MSRFFKSRDYLMKCLGFVLLFGFISLVAIGGCNNNGDGDEVTDDLTQVTIMNNGSDSVCVNITFGADSCFTAPDLGSLCTDTTACPAVTDLCNFELAGNTSQPITTLDNQSNCIGTVTGATKQDDEPSPTSPPQAILTIMLNPPPPFTSACPTTQAEFTLYTSPPSQDSYDISLVNSFTLPVEIEASQGSPSGECGSGSNAGPVTTATGNQMACGVFPLGCTECTNQDKQPCTSPPPPNQCKTGSPSDPDVPCTLNQDSGGTFTVVINPT